MMRAWVVTDGKPGMENQCLGLAEALAAEITVQRIPLAAPWRWVTPQPFIAPLSAVTSELAPPWPDLLIASGRNSVSPSIRIREAAQGGCFTVQIQNPVAHLDRF